jgi:hypothetical protein
MKAPAWTIERVSALATKEIETLRVNAERLNNLDLLKIINTELSAREPIKSVRKNRASSPVAGTYVAGYHFVCDRARGVEHLQNGVFWSGSWVVSKENAELSKLYGAYLALHETKSETSYLQGEIINIREARRSMIDKENFGIEFQVQATGKSYEWIGSGAGEKGYLWEPNKMIIQNS